MKYDRVEIVCGDCGKKFIGTQFARYCYDCRRRRTGEACKKRGLCRIGAEARWRPKAKNVKCKNCVRYSNEWCDKKKDSPDPDILRDCNYFKKKTHYDEIMAMPLDELAEWLSCNCTSDGYGNSAEDWKKYLEQGVEND